MHHGLRTARPVLCQEASAEIVVLHVMSFCFSDTASNKMPPGLNLTMSIAEEIVTDGFITSNIPLRITQLDDGLDPHFASNYDLKAQSIGYSKGQARTLTLLAILSILIQDGVGPAEFAKVLQKKLIVRIDSVRIGSYLWSHYSSNT